METCKVYKNLDVRVKIRGIYSDYFYIVLMILFGAILVAAMTVLSALKNLDMSFLFEVLLEMALPFIAYKYFYSKSNHPKIKKKGVTLTISNRDLYKVLYKKK